MKAKIKYEKFSCKRGDLNIRGFSFLSQSGKLEVNSGKKLKPVVVSHAFSKTHKTTDSFARKMAEWGYAAFTFDFCGGSCCSKSDGKTSDMTVESQIQDLTSVVEYVSSLDYIDRDELVLLGAGFGGLISSLVAVRLKTPIKKLILFFPTFCVPDDARSGQIMTTRFDPDNPPEIIECGHMKLGRRYIVEAQKVNVIKELEQYSGPVCIIHGDRDSLVDIQYSKDAMQIFRANSRDKADTLNKQLFTISGATHGFNKMHEYYAMNIVEQFLQNRFQLMDISVNIKENKMVREKGVKTEVAVFGGKASGEFFSGKIQEGAKNLEKWKVRKPLSLISSYVIKGVDYTGQRIKIEFENQSADGKKWEQKITTDSKALKLLGIEGKSQMVMEYGNSGPYMRLFLPTEGIQFMQADKK